MPWCDDLVVSPAEQSPVLYHPWPLRQAASCDLVPLLLKRQRRTRWRFSPSRHDQNRNTIPADGCAVWVTVLVLSAVRPKSGVLYTRPRYSARSETCVRIGKSAPPPYANTPLV